MDSSLRRLTPLLLVGLGLLVWADALLGGRLLTVRFGSAFHAFAIGILCLYVALGQIERQRLEATFKEVLAVFRQYRDERRREIGSGGAAESPAASERSEAEVQREAVQILIGALGAEEPGVRQTALHNLRRITGQNLGEDAAAWRSWLARDAGSDAGAGTASGTAVDAGGSAGSARRPGDGGER